MKKVLVVMPVHRDGSDAWLALKAFAAKTVYPACEFLLFFDADPLGFFAFPRVSPDLKELRFSKLMGHRRLNFAKVVNLVYAERGGFDLLCWVSPQTVPSKKGWLTEAIAVLEMAAPAGDGVLVWTGTDFGMVGKGWGRKLTEGDYVRSFQGEMVAVASKTGKVVRLESGLLDTSSEALKASRMAERVHDTQELSRVVGPAAPPVPMDTEPKSPRISRLGRARRANGPRSDSKAI